MPQVSPVPYQDGSLTLAVTHKFPRRGKHFEHLCLVFADLESRGLLGSPVVQPAFQQFQVLGRSTAPPKYPEIEDANQLVRDHAREGLPPVLRVLLVDDEFDKGLADALLKILFGNVDFTSRGPGGNEWVYSEIIGPDVACAGHSEGRAAADADSKWKVPDP